MKVERLYPLSLTSQILIKVHQPKSIFFNITLITHHILKTNPYHSSFQPYHKGTMTRQDHSMIGELDEMRKTLERKRLKKQGTTTNKMGS